MSRKASNYKASGRVWLYGRHSVLAALSNPNRELIRLLVAKHVAQELKSSLPNKMEISDEAKITAVVGKDAVHQGIAALVSELPSLDLREVNLGTLVVVLDQVTDPHNVGAVMRSAGAFGAAAVITTERNSPPPSSVLAKAASGALEYVNYIRVGNLAEAITYLKKQNFWVAGLDGEGDKLISEIKGYEKLAIVLGAEGKGMRHKTREYCDLLVKIPMEARQESLNVSNAAAIALWEALKRV